MSIETASAATIAAAKTNTGAAVVAWAIGLLPAGFGAAIMIAVDPPKTKREMALRAFVAFACSYLFHGVAISWVAHLFGWFNPLDESHRNAVLGLIGAVGWFVAGGTSVVLKKLKRKPFEVIGQIRDSFGSRNK